MTSRRERVPQSGRSNKTAAISSVRQQPVRQQPQSNSTEKVPKMPKKKEDLKVSEGDEFGHLTGGAAALVTARITESSGEEKNRLQAEAQEGSRRMLATKARDGHVFGIGFNKSRHMQVRNGTKSYLHFALMDKPLPSNDAAHHTLWRDRGLRLKKKYRGRPRGVEGIVGIDLDGDGQVDEEETMITASMKHTEMAQAAKKHGRTEAEEEKAQEEAAHGHAAEHPELANDSTLHWTAEQKIERGRRSLLKNFWIENHDLAWAIDDSIQGMDMQDSVDSLMECCKNQYKGNFQLMLRNLRYDANHVRRHSSVETQMILRPPATYRGKISTEMEGYETARRQQKERIDRVYVPTARNTGRPQAPQSRGPYDLHAPPSKEHASVFKRTKGTEPDYGNCAGWAHARAMPGLVQRH